MSNAALLLAALTVHLVLTALPMVAAMLLAAALGQRRASLLLCLGLAAGGLIAILAFWAFYASVMVGKTFIYLVPLGSLLLIVVCLRSGQVGPRVLWELATPLALWAFGSAFLVFFGFLHGGTGDPLNMSALRFSEQLPTDNVIPAWFADWFYVHGHHGTPPVFPGEWLFSDRPPLQVGYLLSERTLGWDDTGVRAQVIGVIVQQLWILGLWALLLVCGIGRRARGLTMSALMLSDLIIVHGFYVWPKLLPAAFLLAAAALLLAPGWRQRRRDWRGGAMLGVLLSLALLAHGASVFGLVPLAVFVRASGLPGWRWLAAAVAVGLALLLPWAAYQHWVEPPGNRLTKWMLAGVNSIDNRGTVETIVDSYSEAGFDGTVDNKSNNVKVMTGGSSGWDQFGAAVEAIAEGDVEAGMAGIRWLFFFNLFPSLGLLLLAPAAMAIARMRGHPGGPEWRLSSLCWSAVLAGCVAWGLLMFGGPQSNATIHVGSLLIPLLALAACVLGLYAVLPRFALWWIGFSASLSLVLYAPSLSPPEHTAYSLWVAAFAVAALAAFVAVAFRGAGVSESANTLAR